MKALLRSATAIPPRSLDELRPPVGHRPIALFCTREGCSNCAAFDVEDRAEFQKSLPVSEIQPWDCGNEHKKNLAIDAGVDVLPAYLLIPSFPNGFKVICPFAD